MKTTDRRFFLKSLIVGGIALQIPFVFSCNTNSLESITIKIDEKVFEINLSILRIILDNLFPKSAVSPGALQLNSDIYYIWFLKDSRLKSSKRTFFIENLKRFELFCKEKSGNDFVKLDKNEQSELIKTISRTHWGENYLSRTLSLIMESMFANPVYGSNPDKIGWKWLNYRGGIPEPQEWNKYPEILSLNKSKS